MTKVSREREVPMWKAAAVAQASTKLVEDLRSAAATHWRTEIANVPWITGTAVLNQSKSTLHLTDLARFFNGTVKSFGHYKGGKSDAYSFQAIVADVAVDPEIGQINVMRLYFVYDVTTVINPLTHQGQLEGAIVQGLGYALCEDM